MGKCLRKRSVEGLKMFDIVSDLKCSAISADWGVSGDLVVTADATGLIEKASDKAGVKIAGFITDDRQEKNGFAEVANGFVDVPNATINPVVQASIGAVAYVFSEANGDAHASVDGGTNSVVIGTIINLLSNGRVLIKM